MKPQDPDFPHEEYAILTAATAPGTARELLKCATASTSTEVLMADLLCDARPSGVVLPETLRRKLRLMNKASAMMSASADDSNSKPNDEDGNGSGNGNGGGIGSAANESSSSSSSTAAAHNFLQDTFRILNSIEHVTLFERVAHYDAKRLHSKSPIATIQSAYEQIEDSDKDVIEAHLPMNYEPPTNRVDQDRVFTTTELEKKLSRANAALLDIQKQLYRGEEIYFQDTDMHGNIYKGWEGAFIDSKAEHLGIQDIDSISGDDIAAIVQNHSTATPTRKIHSDMRWFSSSSCAVENGTVRGFERRKSQRSFASMSPTVPIPLSIPTISNHAAIISSNREERSAELKRSSISIAKSENTKPTTCPPENENNVKAFETTNTAESTKAAPAPAPAPQPASTSSHEKEDLTKPASDTETKLKTVGGNDMGPPEPRETNVNVNREADQSLTSNKSLATGESGETDRSDTKTSETEGEIKKNEVSGDEVNQANTSEKVIQDERIDSREAGKEEEEEEEEGSNAQIGEQEKIPVKDTSVPEGEDSNQIVDNPEKGEKELKREREEGDETENDQDDKNEEEVETRTSSRLRKKRK